MARSRSRAGGRGIVALLLAMGALAACSSSNTPPEVAEGEEHIPCALAGATELKPVCAVERVVRGGVLTLVVRHPDGGFRRFDVQTDGSGLAPSDGADAIVARLGEDRMEVTLGADRYLFPVTMKSHDPR
ncbi:MAG: hypothetical protein VYD90_17935 [Pseudomonadota bacterium]|nr:hypothetical protein [Pseudomonadota bacterium]